MFVSAVCVVNREGYQGAHWILKNPLPTTVMGPATQGNRYELSVNWDESTGTFAFGVVGLDDSVDYKLNYTLVSGAI
jgi:hypothetical protein